jgi:hypothetical protein
MSKPLPTNFLFHSVETAADEGADADAVRVRKAVWIDTVGSGGWRGACAAAGVSEQQVVRWLRIDPEFREAHRLTSQETASRLERVIDEIAAGDRDATPQQIAALQFRLRGLRPDVYRDRSTVQVDQTTRVEVGDGGRARLLLAEWSGAADRAPSDGG